MVPVVICTALITALVVMFAFAIFFPFAVKRAVEKTIADREAAELALLEKEEDEAVYELMATTWAFKQVEKKMENGDYGDTSDPELLYNDAVNKKMADDMEFYEALYKSEKTHEDAKADLEFFTMIQSIVEEDD